MRWKKRGRIYVPKGDIAWAKHYAFPPTPLVMPDGHIRVYVAFCDADTVGRVGYVDLSPEDPDTVIGLSEEPVLDIGEPGAFDERGVVPTCVLRVGDDVYLYYVGYQRGTVLPYFQFEGLAISHDDGASFSRLQRTPVIDRSDAELVNRTSAFVQAGETFRMWYVGGSDWTTVRGKPLPRYNVRYLESRDGVTWAPEGQVCLDYANDDEHAFGRPWVIERDSEQLMFYSVRTRSKDYRLGLARSSDGVTWNRCDDDVGIDVSEDGWDSEMVAYSSIVELGDHTYLFYNGNERGKTGFGYAELESW